MFHILKDKVMYGIVNKAVEGLVTENFGSEAWLKIKAKSEVNINNFISNESYDDSVTFKLAIAASEVLEIPLKDVLFKFGEYWILSTGVKHYGALMQSGGSNFKEFLVNLPNFHSRVMLMYPNITPPEFKIVEIAETELALHYYSTRNGLTDFMHGLISGMGKMYYQPIDIQLVNTKSSDFDHDEFLIKW